MKFPVWAVTPNTQSYKSDLGNIMEKDVERLDEPQAISTKIIPYTWQESWYVWHINNTVI